MSKDLSWFKHVDVSVNKGNKVLCLLKSTGCSKNREIFSVLYRLLVRPILEYASPAWSPFLVKDKLAIKSMQHRASKIALRFLMIRDANYWAGAHLSVEENISLW